MRGPKRKSQSIAFHVEGCIVYWKFTTLSLLTAAALFGVFHLPASPAAVFQADRSLVNWSGQITC